MLYILKIIYKSIKSIALRFKHVHCPLSVEFNHKTIFEGCNVVHKRCLISSSFIGYGSYIGHDCDMVNCKIGRFCSIASNVKIVAGNHPTSFVSTHPVFFSLAKQNGTSYCKVKKFDEYLNVDGKSAIIGNDVWIGENAIIKGGVKIGDGAVIAMNSCVTKDVPPYAIVAGVPAKIIRYRFSNTEIEFLLKFKWWNKPVEWIIQNASNFEKIDTFMQINK